MAGGLSLQLWWARRVATYGVDAESHWLIRSALAAMLAHLAETGVGVPVITTELMAWLCAALMLAAGLRHGTARVRVVSAGDFAVAGVAIGALSFPFLGAELQPGFADAALTVSTSVEQSPADWLASASGTTWRTGSAAEWLTLNLGLLTLAGIGTGLLSTAWLPNRGAAPSHDSIGCRHSAPGTRAYSQRWRMWP